MMEEQCEVEGGGKESKGPAPFSCGSCVLH